VWGGLLDDIEPAGKGKRRARGNGNRLESFSPGNSDQ